MQNNIIDPAGELSLRLEADESICGVNREFTKTRLLALMNSAARIVASARARGNVQTATVLNLNVAKLPKHGDIICIFTSVTRVGHTSITIGVTTYVLRSFMQKRIHLASADYVLVPLDASGLPRMFPASA
jgi:acyl-CoA thioesterase YciA